jgi:hypothetical protein
MKVRMSLPVLPTYYYLDHFKEMLSFIESTYASVLDQRFRTRRCQTAKHA